jgi:hypothetical protein
VNKPGAQTDWGLAEDMGHDSQRAAESPFEILGKLLRSEAGKAPVATGVSTDPFALVDIKTSRITEGRSTGGVSSGGGEKREAAKPSSVVVVLQGNLRVEAFLKNFRRLFEGLRKLGE